MTHLFLALCLLGAAVAGAQAQPPAPAPAPQDPPPLVQPGAPGQDTRAITPSQSTDQSGVQFTEADVEFMQGMIGHHQQALEMSALVNERTTSDAMRKLSQRIQISQEDEIGMMQGWLRARGQTLPNPHAHHMHGATLMPGMLTQDEMARLAAARGVEFDRLFLEGMIKHHMGALVMVEALFKTPRAGQDGEIYAFASDVDSDQRMEIERMGAMLRELQ
ncbi:MAG: DUF305 domain-containing protein [Vicinamibacterales bacterium]|nr:DUF305 domain-containing protein [Vicinamibacterales bacterium]